MAVLWEPSLIRGLNVVKYHPRSLSIKLRTKTQAYSLADQCRIVRLNVEEVEADSLSTLQLAGHSGPLVP